MGIQFKSITCESSFLDPRRNFEESSLSFEIRQDPLVETIGLIAEYRLPLLGKPDLSELVRRSLQRECPFCSQNIQTMTPQFPHDFISEGRLRLGEAWVMPNLGPISQYSAVTRISDDHLVNITDFSQEMLTNAFVLSLVYLEKVLAYDPQAKYCSINWNYMPLAGAGQLHPHLQVIANRFPTPYEKQLLDASYKYHESHASNFWADLIDEEQRLGQRYVGNTGDCCWIMNFVPRSTFEAMAIFQCRSSILDLTEKDFQDFACGLKHVLNYIDSQELYGFNMSIYSGLGTDNNFWTNARVLPRFLFPPLDSSDVPFARMMHDLPICLRMPENSCRELKTFFAGI